MSHSELVSTRRVVGILIESCTNGSFVLFLPVAVARFLAVDVIGGIFLILTAGLGAHALKGSMDVSWLLCLALILLLNGIFDAMILIARATDKKYPLFGEALTMETNVVHGLLCAGPLFEFISAIMCWKVYSDHIDNMFEGADLGGIENSGLAQRLAENVANPDFEGYEAFQGQGHRRGSDVPAADGAPASLARRISQRLGFTAFQGEGHRLPE